MKHRKPEKHRKTEYLRVRVTKDQKKTIEDAALSAGIPVSSWALERLLRIAREELGNA